MSTSMFADDPIDNAATQRLASAQESATATGDSLLSNDNSDLYYDSDESEVKEPPKPPPKPQQPNFKDESAFPSLNGGAKSARPTSIWNSSSSNARATMAPIRSQVVSSADLVTETIKLEASEQQNRSLGANHGIGETVSRLHHAIEHACDCTCAHRHWPAAKSPPTGNCQSKAICAHRPVRRCVARLHDVRAVQHNRAHDRYLE